jgi:hypothetical protein
MLLDSRDNRRDLRVVEHVADDRHTRSARSRSM